MPLIDCILHGGLEDFLPEDHVGNRVRLEFAADPSVEEVLEKLQVDPEFLQFVLADGRYIEFEHWQQPLQAGLIQFWPRISGG